MKIVVLSPKKVIIAGIIAALLVAGSVMGSMALLGVFRSDPAEAYGWKTDGGEGVGARTWFFAEGYTGPGFEEWILAFNPPGALGGSGENAIVRVNLYGPNGYLGYAEKTLLPGQRCTLDINAELAKLGYSGDVSVIVDSLEPFICERATYFNYKGQWSGGSQGLGYEEAETGR